ncbi:MAG: MerR family transcriptional regulator [Hyphomicrobiales bacterium]|nr:MerR family transcriptional regulator [Hyphomicrobiales bacterium]
MDKAVGAYRTISEVGEELDIPQHVLRFWETRFPQIKPMKRSGGRRYYRPADVLLLKGIRRLLYGEGYTIKGVQRILATQGAGVVQRAGGASGEELAGLAETETPNGIVARPDTSQAGPVAPPDERSNATHEPETAAIPAARSPAAPENGAQGAFARDLFSGDEVPVASTPRRQRSALSPEHRRSLQAALEDLDECARLLDAFKENGERQPAVPDEL